MEFAVPPPKGSYMGFGIGTEAWDELQGKKKTAKQKCNVCGRQMHKYNSQPWGQHQEYWRYICPFGHIKYVKIK